MSEQQTRPRQAIAAVVVVVAGSVLTVALSYDGIANLHTLKTQQSLRDSLGDHPPVSVATMTAVMHGANLVAGASAAAALVLAAYVWQRRKSARLALSVLAPLIFVSGLLAGNVFVSLVAAAVLTLWLQPTRAWFDGTPLPRAQSAPSRVPRPVWEGPRQPPHPPAWQPGGQPVRPATVTWAVLVTLGLSGLTLLSLGALLGLVLAAPGTLLDEVHRLQPDASFTDSQLLSTTTWTVSVFLVWAVAAALLAVFVWRRSQVARLALMLSSGATAALCLVLTVVGAFVAVPVLAGAVVVLALLARPETRAWFRR